MNRITLRLLATSSVLLVAACQETPPTAPPAASIDLPDQSVSPAASLAARVPGFGGFYLDNGVPTIYLTDESQRSTAEAAVAELGFSGTRTVKARHSYQELDRWFKRVSSEALANAGVVFVDLDEANNRVLVGVENASGTSAARGVAARLGVPASAIAIQETEPIHALATLRDRVRPLTGGLQIRFDFFLCTYGFNANLGSMSGFVVNSHCTTEESEVDGTLYYQPLNRVADELIGTEILDPPFFRRENGCPPSRLCRWSDAAFARRDAGASADFGTIAKTPGANSGLLVIAGSFSIASEAAGNATVGQIVDKVGRTTGWTSGQVTNTCVTTGVAGTRFVRLCQDFVAARVGGGDSGSPAFRVTGPNDVELNGILWGGNSAGTLFVYSPLYLVKRELGALTTH